MKAEPYITKVIFFKKKSLIWSKNTKNKITEETLNLYVFLINVAWLSDQRVNAFMQLYLFPRHFTCKRGPQQTATQRNETSSEEEAADWPPGDAFPALKCQPLLLSSPGAQLRSLRMWCRSYTTGPHHQYAEQAQLLSYWL